MVNTNFKKRIELLIRDLTSGSKKRFSDLIGVSPPSVNDWSKRGQFPSYKHLKKISEKTAININWLLTGIGPTYLDSATRVKKEGIFVCGQDADDLINIRKLDSTHRRELRIVVKAYLISEKKRLQFLETTRRTNHITGKSSTYNSNAKKTQNN